MSWSRIAVGPPSLVKERVQSWAEEQTRLDGETKSAQGHQAQIQMLVTAIVHVCDTLNEDTLLSVRAWGFHDGTPQSNSASLSLKFSVMFGDK